ncbi:hypothetical protein [Orrella sp. 11846]|uniref:hypothetical protein n=1 Tax=Orrella sp. 11846 TaxID=3409913 RepID=UPI003B5958E9
MATAGSIVVELLMRTGSFETDLNRASKRMNEFDRSLSRYARNVALMGTAVVGAFAGMLKSASGYMDEMGNAAERTSVSTKSFTELAYAAERASLSTGELQRILRRSTEAINHAIDGTGKQADALRRLGVSAHDSTGKLKTADVMLKDLADRFSKLEPGAEKTKLVLDLFGQQLGQKVIPLLNQGAEGMEAFADEARRLGLVIDDDAARAAAEFNDILSRMGAGLKGMAVAMAGEALPAVNALMQRFSSVSGALADFGRKAGSAFAQAAQFAGAILDALAPLGKALMSVAQYADIAVAAIAGFYAPAVLLGLAALSKALLVGVAGSIKAITAAMIANPIGAIVAALVAAAYTAYKFRDSIDEVFGIDLMQIVKDSANYIVNSFVLAYELVKYSFSNFPTVMAAAAIGAVNYVNRAFDTMIRAAVSGINFLIRAINNIPGINLDEIEAFQFGTFKNKFAEKIASDINAAEIMARDMFAGMASPDKKPTSEFAGLELPGLDDAGGKGKGGAAKAQNNYISQMQERIALLGKETEYEKLLAQLRIGSISFATEAEREYALALAQTHDMLTKAQKDAQDFQALMKTLYPERAKAEEYAEQVRLVTEAHAMGAIDANEFADALQRIEDLAGDGDFWTNYIEGLEKALHSFDELAGSTLEKFTRGFGDAFSSMIMDAEDFQTAMYNLASGISRSIISALGEMAAQWLVYQGVQLLVGKTTQASAAGAMMANATAQSLQAGLAAYASTAAIPITGPVMAPAAMAAAIAATSPMVGAIGAAALSGMAHDGIDSVPETGTWLLKKGERVVTSQTSAKLDAMLDKSMKGQGGGNAVAVTVNIANGKTDTTAPSGWESFAREIGDFVDARFKELEARSNMQGGAAWSVRQGVL